MSYLQTGARPKTKITNTNETDKIIILETGELTDPHFVYDSDVILNLVDAVSEESIGINQTIFEKYGYADLYKERKSKRNCNNKLYHIDSVLTEYDEPGSVIWATPPKGKMGPIVANAVAQMYYGRAIDDR